MPLEPRHIIRQSQGLARPCGIGQSAFVTNWFESIISSVADGTRPAAAIGTSVTPGQNVYGSYAALISGANNLYASYLCEIGINSIGVAGQSKDLIVTIGLDLAGGTSYTDFISHLLATNAAQYAGLTGQGVWYRFPVYIPAGASVAAKASVNNATVGTARVSCTLYGRPSRVDRLRFGTFVRTYGAVEASSKGTDIVPGEAAEGSWTEIGTTSDPLLALEYGVGSSDNDIASHSIVTDIAHGDASTKNVVMSNRFHGHNSSEQLNKQAHLGFCPIPSGAKLYARQQIGTTAAETNHSIIIYGVG